MGLQRLWGYGYRGYYGKRSADAEAVAEADAEPGYLGYGGYGLGYGYGGYALGYGGYGYGGYRGYGGYGYGRGYGYYGKRSADAEADAEPGYYGYGGYGYGGYRGYGGYGYRVTMARDLLMLSQ